MKICDKYINRGEGLFNKLEKNKKGSILALVVLLGACLFIISSALLLRVNTTTESTKMIDYSENAYLAAKSGLKMLEDAGSTNANFAQRAFNSSSGINGTINMDFKEFGTCKIDLEKVGEDVVDTTTNTTTRTVNVVCTGNYEGNEFTLKRVLTIKKKTGDDAPVTKVDPAALKTYDDQDMTINGGVDGDIYMLGDGKLRLFNSTAGTPLQTVVSKNAIEMSSEGIFADLIAVGENFNSSNATINKDVYVGMKDDAGNFVDDIYYYSDLSRIGGTIRSEGDVFIKTTAEIGTTNRDSEPFITTIPVIICRGNFYSEHSINVEADGSYSPVETGVDGNSNGSMNVYGSIFSGGDVHLSGGIHIYGDIVCGGVVYIEGNPQIDGNIYAGGVDLNGNSVVRTGSAMHTGAIFSSGSGHNIYAKGKVDMGASRGGDNASLYSVHENQTSIAQLTSVDLSTDFVGASKYFEDITEGQMTKPETTFPSDAGLPVIDTSVIPSTGTATIGGDASNYAAVSYRMGNQWYSPKGGTYIAKSCVIDATSQPLTGDIIIDTSKYNENIDIFLKGTLAPKDNDFFIVNDQGGDYRIRIFMYNGSKFTCGTWGQQVVLVADSSTYSEVIDSAVASDGYVSDILESYNVSSRFVLNYKRVAQLYFFNEEKTEANEDDYSVSIDFGGAGWIPGYVLMPSAEVSCPSNTHGYTPGFDDKNCDKIIPGSSYPTVFGMLMCNYTNFPDAKSTFIKFDPNLVKPNSADYSDPDDYAEALAKYNNTMSKFEAATSGVFESESGDGSGSGSGGGSGDGSSGTGTTWDFSIA